MTVLGDVIDLPHMLLGDAPTSFSQRTGEIFTELAVFILIMAIEIFLFYKLYKRIRILEGFLPICANCKKIKNKKEWTHLEAYITEHSLAEFTHSICPECAMKLYPKYYHPSPSDLEERNQ